MFSGTRVWHVLVEKDGNFIVGEKVLFRHVVLRLSFSHQEVKRGRISGCIEDAYDRLSRLLDLGDSRRGESLASPPRSFFVTIGR